MNALVGVAFQLNLTRVELRGSVGHGGGRGGQPNPTASPIGVELSCPTRVRRPRNRCSCVRLGWRPTEPKTYESGSATLAAAGERMRRPARPRPETT